MVKIVEHVTIVESGEILYRCSVCGFVGKDPFQELVPYKNEVRRCPLCGSIVKMAMGLSVKTMGDSGEGMTESGSEIISAR